MKNAINDTVRWIGAVLILVLGAVVAHRLGYIDADIVMRISLGNTGVWMAWYGNRMPKMLVPVPRASARQAQRVAGWSLVLSGLVHAGLWAFAPIPVAAWGGVGAVVTGVLVTLGYCLSLRENRKASG